MSLENYEGTALDIETVNAEEIQPSVASQTEVVETVEQQEVADTTPQSTEPEKPVKYNIDGLGEFTADEIREMKQGSLRQSDYTKKTQELAREREELKNAKELFDYLRQNPHLVEAMKEAEVSPNPIVNTTSVDNELLKKIAYNQKAMEVDMKLNELKQKYGDVDEVALFNKANELHTEDLEFVYKALKYDGIQFDKQAIIEEAKAQIKAELEQNKSIVSTTVDTHQSAPIQNTVTLTAEQKRVASGMGLTESEYIKWLND